MSTNFLVHLEPTEHSVVWWAETEAIPGLSLAANSLAELRQLIDEAASVHLGAEHTVRLQLITDELEPTADPVSWLGDVSADEPSTGTPARRQLVYVA